jgi:hypothetical protein
MSGPVTITEPPPRPLAGEFDPLVGVRYVVIDRERLTRAGGEEVAAAEQEFTTEWQMTPSPPLVRRK